MKGLLRHPGAIGWGACALSFFHESTQGGGGAAALSGQPCPVAWKKGHLAGDDAELWTSWAASGRFRRRFGRTTLVGGDGRIRTRPEVQVHRLSRGVVENQDARRGAAGEGLNGAGYLRERAVCDHPLIMEGGEGHLRVSKMSPKQISPGWNVGEAFAGRHVHFHLRKRKGRPDLGSGRLSRRWCRRAGLNCRPQPYQGCALPLSYGGETEGARYSGPRAAREAPIESQRA